MHSREGGMKHKKKDIDDVLRDKHWEGVKRFTDRFSMDQLLLLDKIVKARDWEQLKDYVKMFGIEPLLEFGMPVGGDGIKELYEINDRYHGHRHKTGAEWWLRDEFNDLTQQLEGYAGDPMLLEKVALAWKEVDAHLEGAPEIKVSAFRKVLLMALVEALYAPEVEEERRLMGRVDDLFKQMRFSDGIAYNHDFVD
jgi:hypothetical protein